ncbi:energy transducer TonB [Sphingomonas sp. BK069]|uniref:energy transducer TonB n=1 Tax=Sphingomonas sp. BK069 TaxID=2586979 RepID=UPI00161A5E34|nr:energy transducer TonB [Sphingomonas sp. BK069]MBB3348375.1 TonB family protein [Sphingomonas sp. BK069]
MRRSLAILLALSSCSGPPAPERGVDTTLNDGDAGAEIAPMEARGVDRGEAASAPTQTSSPGSTDVDRSDVPTESDDDGDDEDGEAPSAAPAVSPAISRAASLRGNPGAFFSADNYPPAAIRAGAEGRVVARLTVGTDGRVSACEITTSSGNVDLDDATCRTATTRVYFSPALDASGSPVSSSYTLPVRWVMP